MAETALENLSIAKQAIDVKSVKSLLSKKMLDTYNARFDHSDEFLGNSLLTLANLISSPRENMFCQQLPQVLMLLDTEVPNVYTGYEAEIGKFSKSYYRADRNWKIEHKISRYKTHPDLSYYLIVVDDKGYYDIVKRTFGEPLTESYGYLNNNAVIDSKTPGTYIHKNEVIYKSTAFDDAMNYRYGKNVNAVYLSCTQVTEDAVWMSDECAQKFQYPMIHSVEMTINMNDILLNLYGNDTVYKTFPDIGEDTKLKVLCAKRHISSKSILFNLRDTNLRNVHFHEDNAFYIDGKVIGIDIFCNREPEEIIKNPVNAQLMYYYTEQQEYYATLKRTLGKIITKNPGKVSDQLRHIYHRAEDLISGKSIVNGTGKFENMSVIFTVLDIKHIQRGFKVTGRFGEKGVVGTITPKQDMPVNQYGIHADVVLSPQGVFGRLNVGQWTETSLTFLADNICRELKTNDIPYVVGMPVLLEFVNDVNPKQAVDINNFYTSCDEAHREQMYSEILTSGLKIHQAPFWDNCGFDELRILYAKYRYPRYTFTYKGQPIIRRLTMGKKYMMVLKQTPESKYSARGLGMQSALGHPSKSIKFKKYELPWSNTPIRIGEMELMGLCMCNEPTEIATWLSTYANSLANREKFVTDIIQAYDPFNITISVPEKRSINRKMLNCLFKSGGARLE